MEKLALATLGGGCFWCLEALYSKIDGINSIKSGYSGGVTVDPTYNHVCSGETGHAEVIQIGFEPMKITYEILLDWFWQFHNPTTLNRQGGDIGTQYRSVIFYHTEEQQKTALQSKEKIEKTHIFKDPIVTEISQIQKFYPAEDYHQNYFKKNPNAGYCNFVIRPKLQKLKL